MVEVDHDTTGYFNVCAVRVYRRRGILGSIFVENFVDDDIVGIFVNILMSILIHALIRSNYCSLKDIQIFDGHQKLYTQRFKPFTFRSK